MRLVICILLVAAVVYYLTCTRKGRLQNGTPAAFPSQVANSWTGGGGTLPASIEGKIQIGT